MTDLPDYLLREYLEARRAECAEVLAYANAQERMAGQTGSWPLVEAMRAAKIRAYMIVKENRGASFATAAPS